jgi:DnaK suppressor protein
MNQSAEYRSALDAERARVTGGDQNDLEVLVVPGGIALEDHAPITHDQFIVLRRRRTDRRKLKMIDAALARLDTGEFGVCDDCGEPIPAKRLKIVPWAECCVPCQDRRDARGGAEADEALEMSA